MIELPEAVVIARQMALDLIGKRIAAAVAGQSPHKFAFFTGEPESYATILPGKTLGAARDNGRLIMLPVEPGYTLVLGEGGERILYHRNAATLPTKHQLWLQFDDGSHLTVSVQGWGAAMLLTPEQLAVHPWVPAYRLSPLEPAFTLEHFLGLWDQPAPDDKTFVKEFIISKPGVWGVGNGYLQDILYRGRIHPRRRARDVSEEERRTLYANIRFTLQQAVDLGGRDTELDLYGQPGRYVKLLDARSVGQPCIYCGTPIEKASFLGGAIYTCPTCQH